MKTGGLWQNYIPDLFLYLMTIIGLTNRDKRSKRTHTLVGWRQRELSRRQRRSEAPVPSLELAAARLPRQAHAQESKLCDNNENTLTQSVLSYSHYSISRAECSCTTYRIVRLIESPAMVQAAVAWWCTMYAMLKFVQQICGAPSIKLNSLELATWGMRGGGSKFWQHR